MLFVENEKKSLSAQEMEETLFWKLNLYDFWLRVAKQTDFIWFFFFHLANYGLFVAFHESIGLICIHGLLITWHFLLNISMALSSNEVDYELKNGRDGFHDYIEVHIDKDC